MFVYINSIYYLNEIHRLNLNQIDRLNELSLIKSECERCTNKNITNNGENQFTYVYILYKF